MESTRDILIFAGIFGCATGLLATGAQAAPCHVRTVRADSPDVRAAFHAAVEDLRGQGGGTVRFERATHHLSKPDPIAFRASNHSPREIRSVYLSVTNAAHVVVDGNGAFFELEEPGMALFIRDAENVVVRDLSIDWRRPIFTEGVIEGFANGRTRMRIDRSRFPVELKDGCLHAIGPGWRHPLCYGNLFRHDTREIVERSSDVVWKGQTSRLDGDSCLIDCDLSKVGRGARPGDVFVMRVPIPVICVHPALCADRAKDVAFSNVFVHASFGKTLLGQMSENISFVGGGTFPRRETGRISSHALDSMHFSNVKGRVLVENARFETMFDDGLNVHSTCLRIEVVENARTVRCHYVHPDSYGFGVLRPGDRVRFVYAAPLENGPVTTVRAVRELDPFNLLVSLDGDLPPGLGVGDGMENADFQPEVVFRGNCVSRNRARGLLINTSGPVTVESNVFDRVSGSAILLPGDANGWYESGACRGVRIRGNVFRHCDTSMFQFGEGVIAIFPEVKDWSRQRTRYHQDVVIEDNVFETHDAPLLYAQSVDGLIWRRNTVIEDTGGYLGWKRPRFRTPHCDNVSIEQPD